MADSPLSPTAQITRAKQFAVAASGWRACMLAACLLLAAGQASAERPTLAIIVDDLGFRWVEDQAVLDLDRRISVAIIPNAPLARRMAEQAERQQRTVLVHLPLTQGPALACDAPLCPQREWSPERVRQHLDWAFEQVPGAVGLNNHQGSHFTADVAATRRLLEGLKLFSSARGAAPFVIDSRTTPRSHLAELAESSGFRTARRDVFLDHDLRPEAMELAWQTAIRIARNRGRAVVIAHPHPESIEFLQRALAQIDDSGIELVPITDILGAGRPPPARFGHPAASVAYDSSPMRPSGP